MRLKWINSCKRSDYFSSDVARVCSQHFDECDYVRDLRNELLGLPLRQKLKPDAVPHISMPNSLSQSSATRHSDRNFRAEKRYLREQVKCVMEIPSSADIAEGAEEPVEEISSILDDAASVFSANSISTQPSEIVFLTAENSRLKQHVKQLQEQLILANEEISRLKHYSSVFEGHFSENQQRALLQGRCAKWFGDDLAKAVTLRCISYKALEFVRNVLKFPIPSDSTIKRRLRQFSVLPGFIELSLSILRTQAPILPDFERNVVLSFDEMKIDSSICFDASEEIISGPSHPDIDDFLVTCFVRTRTFLRIKCLNVRNTEKKLKKRRGNCVRGIEGRKSVKKMKKIVM